MSADRSTAVIITARNYGRYLGLCLRSILSQTLAPQEVHVVDDGSADGTAEVVQSFPSVGYHRVGFSNANRARNFGFSQVSSEWVVFFDADNYMAPDFLECLQSSARDHPEADFLYCDRVNFAEGDVSWYAGRMGVCPSRAFDSRSLRKGNYIDLASLLRASCFPGFDESLKRYQDWDLWLTLVLRDGCRGHHMPRALYYYRVHGEATSKREPAEPSLWAVRRKHRLGWWFRFPGLRSSFAAFRVVRSLKALAGH